MYLSRSFLISTICLLTSTATSLALPSDQTVSYRIYDDPNSPNRSVSFTVVLYLTADSVVGTSVGWAVNEASITQHAYGGNPERNWNKTSPYVNTGDGLWWVTHVDPDAPLLAEFTMMPPMSGVAASLDPEEPDLDYSLAGRVYVPPPTGSHFLITAAMDYVFTEVNSQEPEDEAEDEPVEVDAPGYDERPVGNRLTETSSEVGRPQAR